MSSAQKNTPIAMANAITIIGRPDRILAARPDHLAQFHPRGLRELAEFAAVPAQPERTRRPHDQAAGDHGQREAPGRPRRTNRTPRSRRAARGSTASSARVFRRRRQSVVCTSAMFAAGPCDLLRWQGRRESNPQPAVLETAALPIELLPYVNALTRNHQRGRSRPRPLYQEIRRSPWRRRRRRRSCRPRGSRSAAPAPSQSGRSAPPRS